MHIRFSFAAQFFEANLSKGIDLSIPLLAGDAGVNCFWAPPVEYSPVEMDGFIGSTARGGIVNFYNVRFNPHGNGTHTECVGHIAEHMHKLNDCLRTAHFPAMLLSIYPEKRPDGDRVITKALLADALDGRQMPPACVLRTLPNHSEKKQMHYTNTNPAYLEAAAAEWLADLGVEHLLLDLPSVDRERDGGKLEAHHAFWRYPAQTRLHCTITELIFVPDDAPDGLYLLNIQTAAFDLDASPSRPVLYAAWPVDSQV
jgi:kynurenine formamidase